MIAVHAAIAMAALYWRSAPPPIEMPPEAMMVELAPLPAAAPPPPPPPPPEAVPPPPEPELPPVAEAPKPAIAVAKKEEPKPKPKPKPPEPKKPEPKKPERKPEPPRPEPPKPESKPADDAPPTPAPPAETAATRQQAAPSSSSAPSNAQRTWQSELLSHLGRYKRYPEMARRRGTEGVNRLRFVVDAEGKVLSYEIVGESGSAALDRATLEMIRRAQPLPPPPKEMLKDGSLEIVAPFVYSLERG
ncbi:hypothetical protein GCM10009304_20080 [Pseudomonas matsuisoli]|uniref:TonB C-terminal domain-containing protein n=1 Tax=Pseudomonas matsuisoli TaxID=1515666 RepID=A0A917UX82_9PSED|nr:hypothetical protein GCM10009304_20080 [Pseudomonas matsuisoli]